MCLAIPGKITSINDTSAQADFNGLVREIMLDLVPKAKIGDYVLVHAGYAIEIMSKEEAKKSLDILSDLENVI